MNINKNLITTDVKGNIIVYSIENNTILNKYNFIQLSEDFIILDAHYSRYNSKYKKIFFGRGLYSYKRVNTKWKLFEINTF